MSNYFVRTLIGVELPKEFFFSGKGPAYPQCSVHGVQRQGEFCMHCAELLKRKHTAVASPALQSWAKRLALPIPKAWHRLVEGSAMSMLQVGPAISDEVIEIQIGKVETTHPKAGQHTTAPPPPPRSKIKKVLGQLADLPAEAEEEARTADELRAQIRTLKRELRTAKKGAPDPAAIEKARDQGYRAGLAESRKQLTTLEKSRSSAAVSLQKALRYLDVQIEIPSVAKAVKATRTVMPPRAPQTRRSVTKGNGDIKVKKGARRMLAALAAAQDQQLTKIQLGTMVGMKITGGTFNDYLGTLRRAGLVTTANKIITITGEGLDFVGDVPPAPQTTEELLALWSPKVKAGARKILHLLVEAYPNGYNKGEIAENLDYAMAGGTFNDYLGTLRRNGLIVNNSGVFTASEALFP